jgi:hypothetical protein
MAKDRRVKIHSLFGFAVKPQERRDFLHTIVLLETIARGTDRGCIGTAAARVFRQKAAAHASWTGSFTVALWTLFMPLKFTYSRCPNC